MLSRPFSTVQGVSKTTTAAESTAPYKSAKTPSVGNQKFLEGGLYEATEQIRH